MIELKNIRSVYLIGIGGIGMSSLARYFHQQGARVSGYDRAPSPLTKQLKSEGIMIHYDVVPAQISLIPDLVIYTPAIPSDNELLTFFLNKHLPVFKRSEVLQRIVRDMFCITVAGTHGKTTISTLIAHILRQSGFGCNAFLGGVSVNYNTNYWKNKNQVAVVEADEYDRSFLKLDPDIAVLTAMDADHLDVYGTEKSMQDAYMLYTQQIKENGTLIYKNGLSRSTEMGGSEKISYSLTNNDADSFAKNISIKEGGYTFDIHNKDWSLTNVFLQTGGIHNVENSVAAATAAIKAGIDPDSVKTAISTFKGVKRRFEYIIHKEDQIYIDDYAHHPEELNMLLTSVKQIFPDKQCTILFQPHLFSRTRDMATDFARALNKADIILLLPVYPAREQPIPGVTSQIIADEMKNENVLLVNKNEALAYLEKNHSPLLITAGAGDIDRMTGEIKEIVGKPKMSGLS